MSAPPGMREVRDAAEVVRARARVEPRVGVVLDTASDDVVREIDDAVAIPYAEVLGVSTSTLDEVPGRLVLGRLAGTPVCVLQGRFHRYEGHSLQEVTLPVRILRELGADVLATTGTCASVHPLWSAGDLVLVADHINLMGDNPLVGPNLDEQGPRFPDMTGAYDAGLRKLAREEAVGLGVPVREGVYVGVTGPAPPTPAESRMLRRMGGDVVGVSTVPEVIVARHVGLDVLAVGVVTAVLPPDAPERSDVDEVGSVARRARPLLEDLVRRVLGRLSTVDPPSASNLSSAAELPSAAAR